MSGPAKAVFLSYASEDADVARRLSDSLQAAGVEVWLDQSELRGGDTWDAAIRKRIKDCALFVPLVSANSNARREGYFRLEWKLAVDRSHLMADDEPFLLPVAIDETQETSARVPDRFREVQWSRLSGADGANALVARTCRLLGMDQAATLPAPAPSAMRAPQGSGTPSIAVLPFVNMSQDPENEYFADGLSEELLNVLAKLRGLRVASRTSAFFFKGQKIDIPSVAHKLNVATVLEGSVRKSGKRVRITAQLIDVASDSHVWSETYDRELDDIFAVQDDIAKSVVSALRGALLGDSIDAAVKGRSINPEAYRLYLQGKFFGERLTQPDTNKAIDLLKQAIALDPGFALAWAILSKVYKTQAGFGFSGIEEGFARAREAARRSLDLAPDLDEAHLALGQIQQEHDWDWPAAEASYRRALELAPGSMMATRAVATLARILGQSAKAIELYRKSVELDPLSVQSHRALGNLYVGEGRLEDAESCYRVGLEIDRHAGLINAFLAITRMLRGFPEEALGIAREEKHEVFRNLAFAMVQHRLGNREASDAALKVLIDQFDWTCPYQIAEVHAFRGEVDAAFAWLEKAYTQRDPGATFVMCDALLQPLHSDPRYAAFLTKMRLRG